MSELDVPGKAELAVDHGDYLLTWPAGISAAVERLVEHRDELTAEVTIRSTRPPRPGLLHSARLNLMSTQSRRTLATALDKRDPTLDWTALVEALCYLVRERYRAGEPSIDMREYVPVLGNNWLVEPFVELGGATVLFADGDTGKSLLAIGIAATLATGLAIVGDPRTVPTPVLYLDWETDARTFKTRLAAILAGCAEPWERPPIHYRRMAASLPEAADTVAHELRRLAVGLVILDSLGMARGGEPESADMTIRLFAAARRLGVPWLGIDHVTKTAGNDSTRPFGSTYTHNLARLTWGMDKSEHEDGTLVVSLKNHKHNDWQRLPTLGYRIALEVEGGSLRRITFGPTDIREEPNLRKRLPLRVQMNVALRTGAKTYAELAEEIGAPVDSVRQTANRYLNRPEGFVRLSGVGPGGREVRIANLAREN